ncbi:MAG: NHL repeat-containing protein [bacterium]|nr:NHL repeat-containing protein [bacterium]
MHNLFHKILFLLPLLLLSCAPGHQGRVDRRPDQSRPISLLVEKVIDKDVMGRDLNLPTGLAVDRKDNLYVSDFGNNRVIQFDAQLLPIREIGGQGRNAGLLNGPTYLDLDNDLNLAVSENGNRRVSVFDSRLNFAYLIDFYDFEDTDRFGIPSGVLIGSYGEVWIADEEKSRLSQFDNVGSFERHIGDFGSSGGQLQYPQKLIMLDDENILVCDAGNSELKLYDKYGNYIRRINSPHLVSPVGAALMESMIWVVDAGSSELNLFSSYGESILRLGPSLPGGSVEMRAPSDVVLLSGDRLAVADRGNNRILILSIEVEEKL